jgi:hypothetical protein
LYFSSDGKRTSGRIVHRSLEISSVNFADSGVTNHVTYYYNYYMIPAVNASGISGKSTPVSATPGELPPPVIGNIGVSVGNLIMSGAGGVTNGTCYVLDSTNIGALLTN